jgi:hypothetical protein
MISALLAVGLLFPTVHGENLSGRQMTLPRDFEGRANIVIVAFYREQQLLVNSWLPAIQELQEKYPELHVYELPTIKTGYVLMKWIIDNGMRSGIRDVKTRDHTITLFTDTKKFRANLALPTDQTIYVLLVDSTGNVRWKTDGSMTPMSATKLNAAVSELLKSLPAE